MKHGLILLMGAVWGPSGHPVEDVCRDYFRI